MSNTNCRNTQSDISSVAFYWSHGPSQVLETMTTDQKGAGVDFRRLTHVKSASRVADGEDVFQSEIVIVATEVRKKKLFQRSKQAKLSEFNSFGCPL